jgi:hypothetical protein
MGTKTSQVFVSHTSDMAVFPAGRSFVQAVLDAVARAGMASVDMRYFAARDGQPADYCQQRVRDCDIYIAVVGWRYGSQVPGKRCLIPSWSLSRPPTPGCRDWCSC